MSMAVNRHLAWPCLPVFETLMSETCAVSSQMIRAIFLSDRLMHRSVSLVVPAVPVCLAATWPVLST